MPTSSINVPIHRNPSSTAPKSRPTPSAASAKMIPWTPDPSSPTPGRDEARGFPCPTATIHAKLRTSGVARSPDMPANLPEPISVASRSAAGSNPVLPCLALTEPARTETTRPAPHRAAPRRKTLRQPYPVLSCPVLCCLALDTGLQPRHHRRVSGIPAPHHLASGMQRPLPIQRGVDRLQIRRERRR